MDGLTGRIASTDLLVVRGAVSSSISKPTRLLSSITELRSRRGSGPALAYSLYSPNCVELDFSHLVAYHIAPVRLSTKALGTFCGLVSASDPQKVPLQRTYSCWKVHSEKRGKGVQTLLNMAGRGQESRSVLLRNWVEGHIYPFLSQMAKVELEGKFSEIHASSIASEADRSRWASAWARRSLAFCSTVAIASAPAAKRSGGSSWPASRTSASASLAGSPPCWPFMLFHTATVCSVRSA